MSFFCIVRVLPAIIPLLTTNGPFILPFCPLTPLIISFIFSGLYSNVILLYSSSCAGVTVIGSAYTQLFPSALEYFRFLRFSLSNILV